MQWLSYQLHNAAARAGGSRRRPPTGDCGGVRAEGLGQAAAESRWRAETELAVVAPAFASPARLDRWDRDSGGRFVFRRPRVSAFTPGRKSGARGERHHVERAP